MRLTINEQAQRELIEMMQAKGKYNPTYFINLLITEAYKQHIEVPSTEGSNGKPAAPHATWLHLLPVWQRVSRQEVC